MFKKHLHFYASDVCTWKKKEAAVCFFSSAIMAEPSQEPAGMCTHFVFASLYYALVTEKTSFLLLLLIISIFSS